MNAAEPSTWPKHEDGTNKRVGEMTPDEMRAVFKAAVERRKPALATSSPATEGETK